MQLCSAFLLGLVGSLHCAGMCGPLVLALPRATGVPLWAGRSSYNAGRIVTYALLGLIFGSIGQSFVMIGLQRWASVAAGGAVLLGVFASSRLGLRLPIGGVVGWLKSGLGRMLHRRSVGSLFALGLLNGLLPCGLVYVAGAGAVAAGGLLAGTEYMVAFGVGTVPMMFGLGVGGRQLLARIGPGAQRWIPAGVVVIGLLLVLRGLSLGIPYLSPELGSGCCH